MIPYLVVKNPVGRRQLHKTYDFRGLPISIENAKSSSRLWHNPDNDTTGMSHMKCDYGYIRGTLGVDGDAVDVYIGPDRDAGMVYIVHQKKAPDFTEYDEDKCMLGFASEDAARVAYLKQYNDPRFLGPITAMPFDEFKEKVFAVNGQMVKSHVHSYTRHTSTGKAVFVKDHDDKRAGAEEEPVIAPNGRDSFGSIMGEVAMKTGLPPGPIKLLHGKQFAEHKGFGRAHIAEQHGSEIRAAGYRNEEEFVADVVKSYTAIYKVGDNRYALVAESKGQQKIHIVEIQRKAGAAFYNVITGYIADRQKFSERNHTLLWRRTAIRKSEDAAMGTGRFISLDELRDASRRRIRQIGDSLGVDWDRIPFEEFKAGTLHEWKEHYDVLEGSIDKAAKTALVHLQEHPDYYTVLKRAEKTMKKSVVMPLYLLRAVDACPWIE